MRKHDLGRQYVFCAEELAIKERRLDMGNCALNSVVTVISKRLGAPLPNAWKRLFSLSRGMSIL